MIARIAVLSAATLAGTLLAADSPAAASASRAFEKAGAAAAPLALDFRLRAAGAIQAADPVRAHQLAADALTAADATRDVSLTSTALESAIAVDPALSKALAAHLSARNLTALIGTLTRANHSKEALALFLDHAAALPDPLSPADALWIALTVVPAAPEQCERALRAAVAPGFAANETAQVTATFTSGKTTITTSTTRATIFLLANAYLRAHAPDRLAPFQKLYAKLNLDAGLERKSVRLPPANPPLPEAAAITKRIGTMRDLPTDAARARLVLELLPAVAALPTAAARCGVIRQIASVATEGDLGSKALSGVAAAMAGTLADPSSGATVDDYLALASLSRYERIAVPVSATLEVFTALLELREAIQQQAGFSVTTLDGNTVSLAGLKGRVVLLNFWATWCPPCRKEMPDLEKLHRQFGKQGLTIVAVSDEDRETVTAFLAKNRYTFTVALDPEKKAEDTFGVEAIPKTLVFDREGRLAGTAIDMRTERQLRDLLREAGLR